MLYFSQDSHQELYTFIQTKWQCFKSFIVFTLTKVSAKYSSLMILMHSGTKHQHYHGNYLYGEPPQKYIAPIAPTNEPVVLADLYNFLTITMNYDQCAKQICDPTNMDENDV